MGIGEIAGLGLGLVSEISRASSAAKQAKDARDQVVYINPITGETAYGSDYDKWIKGNNVDLQTHAKAFMPMETYEKLKTEKKIADEKSALDTSLNKLDTLDVSADLAQYEKDLMSSFMESLSPEVRQWAYERGVAGGTPDQDMMAKAAATAAKNAALGKYNLQNQFFQQKEQLKADAINRYNTGIKAPMDLYTLALNNFNANKPATKDEYNWGDLFKGLSSDVNELNKWDQMKELFNPKKKEATADDITLGSENL